MRYDEGRRAVDFGELDVFVGPHHAILSGRRSAAAMGAARGRLDARPDIAALGPMAAAWAALEEPGDAPEMPGPLRPLLRDVGDHVRRLFDEVVVLDEALDRLLNANLARVTVRQNLVLQKVSGWAAIAIVPTIVTGIYGMNFRHMPELGWSAGYPLALLLMVALVVGLRWYFRHVGWF